MAEYLVQDTSLTAVADAIRGKSDVSGSLVFPGDFVSAIEGISSGHSLAVLVPVNSSVTIGKDGETYTNIADSNGVTIFSNLSKGTWSVTVSDGTTSKTETVEITEDCFVKIVLNSIPSFTYDGDYEIVDDDDNEITSSADNWKIRFLTSGTLKFTTLNGAADGIDVFCVGGGGNGSTWTAHTRSYVAAGGGGGGGYTTTKKGVTVTANTTTYKIVVGGAGGTSSGFNVSASGGKSGDATSGGNGGSGGGSWGNAGASDGANATSGGKGQGTTTREFAESGATLYAGGGGGGSEAGGAGGGGAGGNNGQSGTANTGGGGGGGKDSKGSGGSGIVIIRNAR